MNLLDLGSAWRKISGMVRVEPAGQSAFARFAEKEGRYVVFVSVKRE